MEFFQSTFHREQESLLSVFRGRRSLTRLHLNTGVFYRKLLFSPELTYASLRRHAQNVGRNFRKVLKRCFCLMRQWCPLIFMVSALLHTVQVPAVQIYHFSMKPASSVCLSAIAFGGSYVTSSVCLSVRLSVRLQHKISYFPPLDFSDFLHQVSLL